MKRTFDVEKLPKDVLERIDSINFPKGEMKDDDVLVECWLNEGYYFDGMYSYATFNSRQELIDNVRWCEVRK